MRGRPQFIALSCIVVFAAGMLRANDVGDFLDSYCRAVATSSAAARVQCDTYYSGEHVSEISGVATWRGGSDPSMLLTVRRQAFANGESLSTDSMQVSCLDGMIRMADGGHKAFYSEEMGSSGASLLSSRLDVVFLLLLYPQVTDMFRFSSGVVSESMRGDTPVTRLVAEHDDCRIEITVDSTTFLPVRILRESTMSKTRSVLVLTSPSFARGRLPDSMMDVNDVFSFPQRRYDPTGLLSLKSAPDFSINMMDESEFTLSEQEGKWVFLCFRSPCYGQGDANSLYLEKAGYDVRNRGGIFVDIYPSAASSGGKIPWAPTNPYTCRSDVIERMYGISRTGLPCIVLVGPDGRVRDVMIGYIPNVSERKINAVIDRYLPGRR